MIKSKRAGSLLILISLFLIVSGCTQQFTDRDGLKSLSSKAVEEYGKTSFSEKGITFKIKDASSCVLQGNEAVVKINIEVNENNIYNKKTATVISEKDSANKWHVKSVLVE